MNPLRRDASWAMATSTGNSFGNVQLTSQLDHRVVVILLNCAIYLLLQAVHTFYVTDIFKSEGFLPKFDDDRAVLSFFLVLVFSFFIGGERRPSHFFLQLGMALIVIPSLVLFAGSGLPIDFILITLGAYTLVGLVAVSLRFSLPDGIGMRPDTVITPICLGMVAFVGSIFAYGGGQFLNFDFGKVYQFRSEASENLPAIYRYLVPIFTQAVIPFGLANGMYAKLSGLNIVGMRRRKFTKDRLVTVRAFFQDLFYSRGPFAERLAKVQHRASEDPAIAEILGFIGGGKRPLCMPPDGATGPSTSD